MGAQSIRVVVADDDLEVAGGAAQMLELYGFVSIAVTEAEAIHETVRRERPRVLVQDLRMPGLDLELLLRELRDDASVQPLAIVVWSALVDDEERWRALGAARVVEKPIAPRALKRLILELAEAADPSGPLAR